MPGEQDDPELNDQKVLIEMDRDLKAALSVSPTLDFETRVLRRIEERTSRPSRTWTLFSVRLAAAAAVVLSTTTAVWMTRPRVEDQMPRPEVATPVLPEPDRQPVQGSAVSAGVLTSAQAPAAEDGVSRTSPRAARRAAARSATSVQEAEVLVPPEHAEAVRRFARGMAEHPIEVPPAPDHTTADAPEALSITPVVIEPIPIPAVERRGGPTPVVRGLQ